MQGPHHQLACVWRRGAREGGVHQPRRQTTRNGPSQVGCIGEEDWHHPRRSGLREIDPGNNYGLLWQGCACPPQRRQRDATLATFDHAISTDEKPQHDCCPVGADSWCFYQKALVTEQEPGPHRTNVGTPLSSDVAEHVRAVYTRLAHFDLLKRCKLGKTQNNNETVHTVIWNKCPKTSFVGLECDVSATCSAVSEFNAGVEVTMKNLCDVMQVPSGVHLLESAEKTDPDGG